jgi:hypothetical protein
MAQYSSIPAVNTSFGSREINGQLVPVFTGSSFLNVGNAVGPTYYGYGSNTPATIPLSQGAVAGGPTPAMGGSQFQLTPRTAIILGIMLVVGIAGLRYIHWRA